MWSRRLGRAGFFLVLMQSGIFVIADEKTPPRSAANDAKVMTGECERLYKEACRECRAGRLNASLALLKRSARAGPLCVTRSLTEPTLIGLHENRGFRELMRENARQSSIRLVPPDEPGEALHVSGIVVDDDLKPVANALIYVYQTNHVGNYSSTGGNATMGDSLNPKLFGYLRTGKDGRYEFRTIRPGGYPGDGPPAHIHYEVKAEGFKDLVTEMMFRDDRRLTRSIMREVVESGFIVSEVRREGGVQRCVCDLMMEKN